MLLTLKKSIRFDIENSVYRLVDVIFFQTYANFLFLYNYIKTNLFTVSDVAATKRFELTFCS